MVSVPPRMRHFNIAAAAAAVCGALLAATLGAAGTPAASAAQSAPDHRIGALGVRAAPDAAGLVGQTLPSQAAIIARSPLARGKTAPAPETAEPYEPQSTCIPFEQPGVAAFRTIVYRTYPRTAFERNNYNILRACSARELSEHLEGRAFDFKADVANPLQLRQAEALINWLIADEGAQAKRFGIMYIIYRQHIWAQYLPFWRKMEDRGDKTSNHRDHVHFSFTWNGALKRTSYWTGQTPPPDYGPCRPFRGLLSGWPSLSIDRAPQLTPCQDPEPTPRALHKFDPMVQGDSSARVARLQRFLNRQGYSHQGASGYYGAGTYFAVRRFQKTKGLTPTGNWDRVTQQATGRTFR